jgi:hypothetical protein
VVAVSHGDDRGRRGRRFRGGAGAALLAGLFAAPVLAAPADEYAVLLARSVRDDGVDYRELAEGRAALDAYVRWLESADPGVAPAHRAAFWINAHNALVLRHLLDTRPPLVDLAEVGRVAAKVGGQATTVDSLATLARESAGPLTRFALYRGTRSCPPLPAVLYRGADLAEALEQQARGYLSDEEENRFAYAQLEAELSTLFLWHRDEFDPLQPFLADHLPGDMEEIARSLRRTEWRISFRPYDRSLAEAGGGPRRPHPVWLALYAVAAAALLLLGVRAVRGLLRGSSPLPRAPSPP